MLVFARVSPGSRRGLARVSPGAEPVRPPLAGARRIDGALVDEEISRLVSSWRRQDPDPDPDRAVLEPLLGAEGYSGLDRFDRVQLAEVVRIVQRTASLVAAGRELFSESRKRKSSSNDADRVRKYLARFGVLDALR